MILFLFQLLLPVFSTLLALGLAVFVLTRNRRAWANRWLAIGLAAVGFHQAAIVASTLAVGGVWRLVFFQLALAVAVTIPPSWLAFSLTFAQSNGGSPIRRWHPALIGMGAAVPLSWYGLAAGQIILPVRLENTHTVFLALDVWGKVYFSYYLAALAVVLLHLENLYRSAERLTRWKIKYLVVGVFMAFACQIVAASYALLYGLIHPLHPFFGALAFLIGEGMIAFSLVRHRLLDVDIFVSRYVIYRSLTLALVGGYLVSLGVIAEVFRQLDFTLDLLSGTFLAILGAVALSLVLLSDDVRRSVQRFVHTHFYKHKYDYRMEWMEFTRRLSRATAIPEIATQTLNRILEVMWIREAAFYTAADLPGSMNLAHEIGYSGLPRTLELSQPVLETLQVQAKLIPSESEPTESSDVTARLIREAFRGFPVGCIVPVAALDSLVGLLVVGPEMSGKPFGVDDRDLLAAVAAQAGALLLNARLSQEASEGREIQVLARLSAFVAHDLKNAVSTLSMLAENARQHMGKPEFQADAIRTVAEVTGNMQRLLTTLASPQRHVGGSVQPISLSSSVETWLREIGSNVAPRIRIEARLGSTPEVRVDPDQFRSVLHNLVLNGIEATPGEGVIIVETFQENGRAVLAVTDTGRGMAEDFVRKKLFRPFQTTKPRGLGIGLYQCRHIVQAYGGSLTVESQIGKGTRMIVRLPPADPGSRKLAPASSFSPVEG